MKLIKLKILLIVGSISMLSCSIGKNVANKNIQNDTYIKYLSSIINDTTFYEIPELSIVDNGIYPVLDSIILWSEECKYFERKIKYLNSFRFEALPKDNNLRYFINAHLSPYSAVGLLLVKTKDIKNIETHVAIFYYKHYLFVVPTGDYRGQKNLEFFPFFKLSGNNLKIRAPEFLEEKSYDSYLTFIKKNGRFSVIENKICGPQILIQ